MNIYPFKTLIPKGKPKRDSNLCIKQKQFIGMARRRNNVKCQLLKARFKYLGAKTRL